MTVGKKISLGFSSVLILLAVVGGIAFYALTGASKGFSQYREMARDSNLAGHLHADMLMVRMNVKDFLITGSDKDLGEYGDYYKKMLGFLEEAQKEIQNVERAEKIDKVDAEVDEYNAGFEKVVEFKKQRNQIVNQVLNVNGPLMEKTLTEVMTSADADNDMTAAFHSGLAMKHLLLGRLYMAKFLDTNDKKSADRVNQEFGKMQEQLNILDRELENIQRRKMLLVVAEAKNTYSKNFNTLVKVIFDRNEIIAGTLDHIGPAIAKNVEDVKLSIKAVQDDLGPKLVASNNRSNMLVIAISIAAIIFGAILSFFITRSIIKPLGRAIGGLKDGADQVASASSEISVSSQQLAEGSSEQAASIEESSSSLEEMSSMTKQNSENASEADSLMRESNQVVAQANNSMRELIESMSDISKASEKTSKIIKTIDEIAFQTNLLALNAAVEAARAGEAGAGFAVVADEVRNLAMRAAEAAKDTAGLIDGTVKKVKDGSEIVSRTNDAFTKVAQSSTKVGELVSEIAAASSEQAQGIEQINTSVIEMDKVVQQNASNAEENASASEEMNAQSEQIMAFVNNLADMIGGNGNGRRQNSSTMIKSRPTANHIKLAGLAGKIRKVPAHQSKEASVEQILPLDDDVFKDF